MKMTCPMSLCVGKILPKVSETYLVVMHFQFPLRVRLGICTNINIDDNVTTNNDKICFIMPPKFYETKLRGASWLVNP